MTITPKPALIAALVGAVMALKAGVALSSVRRPLEGTVVCSV